MKPCYSEHMQIEVPLVAKLCITWYVGESRDQPWHTQKKRWSRGTDDEQFDYFIIIEGNDYETRPISLL